MEEQKLNSLLWESDYLGENWFYGQKRVIQKNLDGVQFKNVDKIVVTRDADYNISLSCVRFINHLKTMETKTECLDTIAGTYVPPGKLKVDYYENCSVVLEPLYFNGYSSTLDKTEYNLTCYRIEGKKGSKNVKVLKEWYLNGGTRGLRTYHNREFRYTTESATFGSYGDIAFPIKQSIREREYRGSYIHIKYKDTAFDIHFVGSSLGPDWSTNLSISYFEEYGRIPDDKERQIVRDYLSFFMGKRLLFVGNSSFDENGNIIGFVMESPKTFGFDIKTLCQNGAKTPIKNESDFILDYVDSLQRYINIFDVIYNKLDLGNLFVHYWYAAEVPRPLDLPILASALEHLMKRWFLEIDSNPDTLLMDKKEFKNRIRPVEQLVLDQFSGTEYVERMKNQIANMNRMSIREQFDYFFERIGLIIGKTEKMAMQARNASAHGAYDSKYSDFVKDNFMSQVYYCLINRTVLKLMGYNGHYVDFGKTGFPDKNINCPSGDD